MVPSYLHLGPAPDFSKRSDRRFRRMLEIFPGALTWVTLLGIPLGSFVAPAWAAAFIILFATYWILNALYFSFFLVRSWLKLRRNTRVDWAAKLAQLPRAFPETGGVHPELPSVQTWKDIVHLLIFPMYTESVEVVGGALAAAASADYPKENLFVVLATEQRAGMRAQETARILSKKFSGRFGKFLVTVHPANLSHEIPGKGSNEAYAAQEAMRTLIEPLGIPYERVVVSSFDSDTSVYPSYFSCVTFHYLTARHPTRTSYQPIPLFHNNIWEAPMFSRVAAIGSTAWQLFMQTQPDLQETFSSHSMSLQALVDIGFWNTRLVNEDSVIFWQCFLAFDGNYRVDPLFYPVSMDANVSTYVFATAASVYRQHRRWAYGIEKMIYAIYGFTKNDRIPLRKKISRSGRLIAGFWMWACASPLLLTLGWLPVVIGGEEFRQTVLAFNLPLWTRNIMTVASVGLLVNGALTFLLLPPRPKGVSRFAYVTMLLQWPLMPFTMFFFGSLPAIDAQTRMMFGKYLGFWVTEKARKKR